eukprot:2086616-Prymnesium_polylepis.1
MREQGGGGPSAMGLYSQHTSADLGHAKAAELANIELAAQQKFAMPMESADWTPVVSAGVPEWYNKAGLKPAKYDIPTGMKERMEAKEGLRRAVPDYGGNAVQPTDPIEPEEIDYIMVMKRQAELADFDRYVNTLVDPKKPGNLKWLMEVYPEFVHRRIAQVHDDYDFAIRNQMIDSYGINSMDDLHFKYLVDQGKISGGALARRQSLGAPRSTQDGHPRSRGIARGFPNNLFSSL